MSFSGSFPLCILSSRGITQKHQETGIPVTHIQPQKLIFILFSFYFLLREWLQSIHILHGKYIYIAVAESPHSGHPHCLTGSWLKRSHTLCKVYATFLNYIHWEFFFRLSFVSSSSLTPCLHRVRNHQGDIWRTIQEATAKMFQCGSKWQFRKWKILSTFLM